MTDSPSHPRDFRQELTNRIIEKLERGVAPWQKPWDGSISLPYNPTSKKPYRGGNVLNLIMTAMDKGYDDNRWITFKQAKDNGWQVRKGEKGTLIEFWEFRNGAVAKDGDEETEEAPRRFIHRVYVVFNAEQVEGIPQLERKERAPVEIIEAGESILRNSGAAIHHDQIDKAFYRRSSDSIHLPKRERFKGVPEYYSTALHELGHWTGHPDRLARPTLTEAYTFGDQNYAKEELRAELTSIMLAAERGIPHDPDRHAAYVGNWIKALKDDKNEIFRAAADASKACDYILAFEQAKDVAQEPAREELVHVPPPASIAARVKKRREEQTLTLDL